MCHVLIIEDEILVALDIEAYLAACGATSFSFATTEVEAIEQARLRRPEFITSDVRLACGSGPAAVAAIHAELGSMPTVFITGTPEECEPCPPPARILGKPMHDGAITQAFLEMAEL